MGLIPDKNQHQLSLWTDFSYIQWTQQNHRYLSPIKVLELSGSRMRFQWIKIQSVVTEKNESESQIKIYKSHFFADLTCNSSDARIKIVNFIIRKLLAVGNLPKRTLIKKIHPVVLDRVMLHNQESALVIAHFAFSVYQDYDTRNKPQINCSEKHST